MMKSEPLQAESQGNEFYSLSIKIMEECLDIHCVIRLFNSRWPPPPPPAELHGCLWSSNNREQQSRPDSFLPTRRSSSVKENKTFPSQIKLERVSFVHLPCLLQHFTSAPFFLHSASLLGFIMHSVSQGISAIVIMPENFKRWFEAATVIVVMWVDSFEINKSMG